MPLNQAPTRAAFSQNVSEMIRAGHPRAQALAAAYRAARGNGAHFAIGGLAPMPQPPWYVRSEAREMARPAPRGLIASAVPGRTDRIGLNAAPGSYIVPADVVSGIGQGNTLAGAKIFDQLLASGPYGSKGGGHPYGARGRPGIPSAPRLSGLASGGATPQERTPIITAGGEYVISPEQVEGVGGGDVNEGHKRLNTMVEHIRKQVVRHVKNLPGPKR